MDGLAEEVNLIVERKLASRSQPSTADGGQQSYADVAGTMARGSEGVTCARPRTTISPEKRKEESYWNCRKALRLRPIPAGDAVVEVKKFMTEQLGLGSHFMDSVGPFSVQRVPYGPAAKIKQEVIVSYLSTDVRDAVKGSARNLAGKGRDYGVRLEIPNHLKSAMKALQSVSFQIKSKYPDARRNVLFDDGTMDLVLDFCVSEGGQWKRMTSMQALGRLKKMPSEGGTKAALREGEIDSLLDGSGGDDGDDDDDECEGSLGLVCG